MLRRKACKKNNNKGLFGSYEWWDPRLGTRLGLFGDWHGVWCVPEKNGVDQLQAVVQQSPEKRTEIIVVLWAELAGTQLANHQGARLEGAVQIPRVEEAAHVVSLLLNALAGIIQPLVLCAKHTKRGKKKMSTLSRDGGRRTTTGDGFSEVSRTGRKARERRMGKDRWLPRSIDSIVNHFGKKTDKQTATRGPRVRRASLPAQDPAWWTWRKLPSVW